jgi:hypothetical protein
MKIRKLYIESKFFMLLFLKMFCTLLYLSTYHLKRLNDHRKSLKEQIIFFLKGQHITIDDEESKTSLYGKI